MSENAITEIRPERARFLELLLANPNYFGTAPDLDFPQVLPLTGQTTYEELTCVGLQAGLDQLEAVIQVKLNSGYAGPLCSSGSVEYVRFYLSEDGGATWTDEGLASFGVYDTPGPRPLAYAVDLHVAISHQICFFVHEPRIRAILSWNQAPPPNSPGFMPVWGNVLEVTVAPSSTLFIPLGELLDQAELTVPEKLAGVVDLAAQVKTAQQAPPTLADLRDLYEGTVAPHRYAFPFVRQLTSAAATAAASPAQAPVPASQFAELGLDLAAVLASLGEVDGDTYYEHLDCIGYDPRDDSLIGVLTVRQSSGYNGGPCTAGSREYVAFWIDWGSGWTYAGTASVPVHDYPVVPAGGLKFAVYQPINSGAQRQNCADGPVQPAVRATLSWQDPPPPGNPDWVPTWGNQLDAVIQLAPGALQQFQPVIEAISDVGVCQIDQLTGLTLPPYYQPFGGVLTVSGFIPGAPFRPLPGLRYRVSVRPSGSAAWQPLANTFDVTCTQFPGVQTQVTQTPDGQGFYPYLEDDNPANWRRVVDDVLGIWITAQPMTGLWEILVEARDSGGTTYLAQVISCQSGQTVGPTVTVCLDEIPPTATLAITQYVRNGVTHPAQGCMKFKQGDLVIGTYSAADPHFRYLSLILDPPSGVMPVPAQVLPIQPSTGVSGTWQLDTTDLKPCGYVVRLRSWDTTIVSGDASGWESAELAVGFCLE